MAKSRDSYYFVQIGFDFGTSFSKCVCRDVITNKAWVYIPPWIKDEINPFPFLIPSTLLHKDRKLKVFQKTSITYSRSGLHHLKLALVKIALEEFNDPVLIPYKKVVGSDSDRRLSKFVRLCGVFFLALTLGYVRESIRRRFPGSHSDDYMAVNLAVPVADAEQSAVNDIFSEVLCDGWSLADRVINRSVSTVKEIIAGCGGNENETCYLYPETSANVQGFVRSRVSQPGIYLFSDTGAGTVDQSVFIFHRNGGSDSLTYLHGSVLPLGSSRIEYIANEKKADWETLEEWRIKKESGENAPELQKARNSIRKDLCADTITTLAYAKGKLFVKAQINDTRIIFGGGGHCGHPYSTGVKEAFNANIFPAGLVPKVVGLPIPNDLNLEGHGASWMNRLYVAYGLSFLRHDLAEFKYPNDVKNPTPGEIWKPIAQKPEAPSKDIC